MDGEHLSMLTLCPSCPLTHTHTHTLLGTSLPLTRMSVDQSGVNLGWRNPPLGKVPKGGKLLLIRTFTYLYLPVLLAESRN